MLEHKTAHAAVCQEGCQKGYCEGEEDGFLYEKMQNNFIVSNKKDWE